MNKFVQLESEPVVNKWIAIGKAFGDVGKALNEDEKTQALIDNEKNKTNISKQNAQTNKTKVDNDNINTKKSLSIQDKNADTQDKKVSNQNSQFYSRLAENKRHNIATESLTSEQIVNKYMIDNLTLDLKQQQIDNQAQQFDKKFGLSEDKLAHTIFKDNAELDIQQQKVDNDYQLGKDKIEIAQQKANTEQEKVQIKKEKDSKLEIFDGKPKSNFQATMNLIDTIKKIEEFDKENNLDGYVGNINGMTPYLTEKGRKFESLVNDILLGKTSVLAGTLSDRDMKLLKSSGLSEMLDVKDFRKALEELKQKTMDNLQDSYKSYSSKYDIGENTTNRYNSYFKKPKEEEPKDHTPQVVEKRTTEDILSKSKDIDSMFL
jgi:hypothetical protein